MLSPHVHARRRHRLAERVPGPILLLGNAVRDRNLPGYGVPFRQDSNFLYFVGCDLPDAVALLHDGKTTLFVPPPSPDDHLWHGHVTTFDALRERFGVDEVRSLADVDAAVPRDARTLAVPDAGRNALGTALTGQPLAFGTAYGDRDLVTAVIAMRRAKEPEEIAQMRLAARHTEAAFDAVMRGTRPGGSERALCALFEGVLAARGCGTGYQTILTQSGEILHNHAHDQVLEAGRLLLLDGGGEVASGYGVDITRTWPVSGTWTPPQRAAYDAVLAAQAAATAKCTAGTRYRDVHDTASLLLARWLCDEGLLRGDPADAVAMGAHAVFFPHGVGHLLGLDVHDLEAFGDLPAYPSGQGRSPQFGTRYLRLDLPLEPGWIVTIEPGFYVVPGILHDPALRERFVGVVDFDRAERWIGFGGVRIEDDVLVTTGAPDVLTAVPRDADAVAACVGAGPTAEERLCSPS